MNKDQEKLLQLVIEFSKKNPANYSEKEKFAAKMCEVMPHKFWLNIKYFQ